MKTPASIRWFSPLQQENLDLLRRKGRQKSRLASFARRKARTHIGRKTRDSWKPWNLMTGWILMILSSWSFECWPNKEVETWNLFTVGIYKIPCHTWHTCTVLSLHRRMFTGGSPCIFEFASGEALGPVFSREHPFVQLLLGLLWYSRTNSSWNDTGNGWGLLGLTALSTMKVCKMYKVCMYYVFFVVIYILLQIDLFSGINCIY